MIGGCSTQGGAFTHKHRHTSEKHAQAESIKWVLCRKWYIRLAEPFMGRIRAENTPVLWTQIPQVLRCLSRCPGMLIFILYAIERNTCIVKQWTGVLKLESERFSNVAEVPHPPLETVDKSNIFLHKFFQIKYLQRCPSTASREFLPTSKSCHNPQRKKNCLHVDCLHWSMRRFEFSNFFQLVWASKAETDRRVITLT